MFDTYVFDLDGTLLDTLDDLTSSVNAALEAFGCPVRSREEVRGFVGNGIRLLVRRAAPCGADFAGIFEAFKAHYAAHCFDKTKPYAGVTELLTQLKARGAKTAIVSNKADFAVRELSARFFGRLINAAAGEREDAGIRKKPAPDSVLSVLKLLEEDGKREVYIGDSEVDIETAKNAGLPCISVTWGFKSRAFLEGPGASFFADKPMDILSF